MRNHHAIHLSDELAEDGQFVALQLFAGAHDHGKFVMRVKASAGIAGEMFAATQDAGGAQRGVKVFGIRDNLRGRATVTSPS